MNDSTTSLPISNPICPRCGFNAEMGDSQCSRCGEILITASPKKHLTFNPLQTTKSSDPDNGIRINPPPVILQPTFATSVLKIGFGVAGASMLLAGFSYLLAWLPWRYNVSCLNASIILLMAAVGIVVMSLLAVVGFYVFITAKSGLAKNHTRREADKSAYALNSPPQTKNTLSSRRREPQPIPVSNPVRSRPGTATLVFSTLAIIFSTLSLFISIIPGIGFLSIVTTIPSAIVFTIISLVLCHYERSERLLPFIATGLLTFSILCLLCQYIYVYMAVRETGNALNRFGTNMMHSLPRTPSQPPSNPFFVPTPQPTPRRP